MKNYISSVVQNYCDLYYVRIMSIEREKSKEYIENVLKRKDKRLLFICQDNNQFIELFEIDKMNFTICVIYKIL